MTAYPPLPEPHPVRHKLFVNGRFVAACDCHMGTPLTQAGELPPPRALGRSLVSADFDAAKVAHVLRGYRARLDAQRLLADELETLADEARREQYRQDSDFRARIDAWRGHGVEIPAELADPDGEW